MPIKIKFWRETVINSEKTFMLRKCFIMFSVFLLLVALQPLNSAPVQMQQNPGVRPFTDLTLEITTPSQSLPLQPIPIVIKQSNRTNQPVLGYKSIGFGRTPIHLYVKRSDGERVLIGNLSPIRRLITVKNMAIAPGASSEAKEWLTLALNRYFPEPGIYQLQAELENEDRTLSIESNTVNIEIKQPIGVDLQAYNLINNSPMQEALFSGAEFDRAKDTLEEIKTRFPTSAYARGAFFVLGEAYFSRRQYGQALANLIRLEHDNTFAKKIFEKLR